MQQRLASLIVNNLKGYGIAVFGPDGAIRHWLGDAETITGYGEPEALTMNLADLFIEADQASGAPTQEIAIALSTGRAEDSRWHRRRDGQPFWANGLTVRLTEDDDLLVKVFRDETPSKLADEQRLLLLNELNHRVKNTLATVQSVVEQTLRAARIDETVRDNLSERLIALSRAHNVLVDQNWAGADLRPLVQGVIEPYQREPSPFDLEGPEVRLHPSQAVNVSLALHELTTNAVKYGALSVADGKVRIAWNLAQNGLGERFLSVLWRERHGPPVAPPIHSGFGSRLIRQTFRREDGGRAEIVFDPQGVSCAMSIKLIDQEGLFDDGSPADAGV